MGLLLLVVLVVVEVGQLCEWAGLELAVLEVEEVTLTPGIVRLSVLILQIGIS